MQSSQFIYNHDTLPFKEGAERAIEQQRQKGYVTYSPCCRQLP